MENECCPDEKSERGKMATGIILTGIGVPRHVLRERIRARVARMFDDGLVEEVRGLTLGQTASQAVGYTAGVIDLLYADPETGEWVVADYKSDAVESDAEIRALAGTYAAQGAVYTEAVRAALQLDAPPRFELWLLHAGRILPVPAATLAAP